MGEGLINLRRAIPWVNLDNGRVLVKKSAKFSALARHWIENCSWRTRSRTQWKRISMALGRRWLTVSYWQCQWHICCIQLLELGAVGSRGRLGYSVELQHADNYYTMQHTLLHAAYSANDVNNWAHSINWTIDDSVIFIAKVRIVTSSRSSVRLGMVWGVRVDYQAQGTGAVGDAKGRVCSEVLEQAIGCIFNIFCGHRLSGT
jgi:hypothetical protein